MNLTQEIFFVENTLIFELFVLKYKLYSIDRRIRRSNKQNFYSFEFNTDFSLTYIQ